MSVANSTLPVATHDLVQWLPPHLRPLASSSMAPEMLRAVIALGQKRCTLVEHAPSGKSGNHPYTCWLMDGKPATEMDLIRAARAKVSRR